MKTRVSLLIGLVASLLTGPASGGEVAVTDGDGLRIGNEHIRLFGIDAPELEQRCERNGTAYACGAESRAALNRLVARGQISCQTVDEDRYDRTVARCSVNGEDLGAAMVRAGWAVDFERYSNGAYAVEERDARLAKRGLWAGEFDLPSVWRRNHFKACFVAAPERCVATRFSPQTCHKLNRTRKDNGGFLRVTGGQRFVAKKAPKGLFLSVSIV